MSDDELDPTLRDRIVDAAKGAVAAIPFAGGALSELISNVIPGQRQDRIVLYVRELEMRISDLEASEIEGFSGSPDKIDLIERGGFQAVQALSESRISTIATLVSSGLKENESSLLRKKRLLRILGQIDDDELAVLTAYGMNYANRAPEYFDRINRPDPPHLAAAKELIEQNKLYDAGITNLLSLELLRKRYRIDRGAEVPKFDKIKGEFVGHIEISYLGRMLLRQIGVELPFED